MKKNSLLEIYKKINPSLRSNYKKQSNVNLKILQNKFNLDMSFFKNKKVLDLASGIGDNAINYAKYGAHVTLIDFNDISINYAKKIFKKNDIKNSKFIVGDVFNQIKRINNKFDFVNCTGALHHFDKTTKGALKEIFKVIKKNGHLYLSVGVNTGGLQHKIMKALSRKWGHQENQIKKSSTKLFKEYLDRSVKYGMRSKDQVINDQFVNHIHNYISIEELARFSEKNNFRIIHTEPKINYLSGDSVRKSLNTLDEFSNKNSFRQQYYWASKNKDDKTNFELNDKIYSSFFKFVDLANKNSEKKNFFSNYKTLNALKKFNLFHKKFIKHEISLIKEKEKFYRELEKLMKLFSNANLDLNRASKTLNKSKNLFRNTAGLTLNYFLLKKMK
jgi:ubiquinone/menaquinone biosynthesis C-methylase UbiE